MGSDDVKGWLARQANTLLADAEGRFGRRDPTWTFAGIEFEAKGPFIWFPPGDNIISIKLSPDSERDLNKALHQLAHEVIHLLAPAKCGATVLEEGLAVSFSIEAPSFPHPSYCGTAREHIEKQGGVYKDALFAYERLTAIDPHAVWKLRLIEPHFGSMTPSFIREQFPRVPTDLAALLCERR